jgi:hypothetical protein
MPEIYQDRPAADSALTLIQDLDPTAAPLQRKRCAVPLYRDLY